ncbi:MAG: TlpA family protein disulfide reductase [Anaerolineales bacterium]
MTPQRIGWLTAGVLVSAVVALVTIWLLDSEAAEDAPPTPPPNLSFISPSVNITPDENRFVITVWQGGDYFTDITRMEVAARNPNQAGHPVTWRGEAQNYNDYAIPYWVVYPDFTATGLWRVEASVHTSDGAQISGTLIANVGRPPASVLTGMTAPPSDTLSNADGRDLFRMTSDATPLRGLYDLSIADALANERPSIIFFASPGLCSNAICAPVVDSTAEAVYEAYSDRFNVLHVEIYDLDTADYVPAMEEWGLTYEPWTYIVSPDGQVVNRYDGPISLTELAPYLEAGGAF